MKLVPLGPNVVVKRLDAEATTSGGIVLPDSAQQKSTEGRVLSVGDGKRLADGSRSRPLVSEGDRVVFRTYAGTEIEVQEQTLLILNEDDILAILR